MKFVIKKHKTGNKGVALLTVLVSVFIISLLTIEFQYSVAIERKLSYSDLNQLQAHYLAKSGVKFALLRLVLFSRANKDKSLGQVKPFLPAIWNLPIPAFPPAKSKIKQLFKADQDAAEKAIEETKISIGQFTETISSESAKINLNALLIPVAQQGQSVFSIPNPSNSPQKGLHFYVANLLFNTI
ncbi:MAG: type II secretion system protein GspK, partial [Proteobacteria bacterium]|nr:type II secretion system protein GspK [Pseudomonadota bacterium]